MQHWQPGLLLPSSTVVSKLLSAQRQMITVPTCKKKGDRPGGSHHQCLLKDQRSPNLRCCGGANLPSLQSTKALCKPHPLYPHSSILVPIAALAAVEQCCIQLFPGAPSSSSLLIHQPPTSEPDLWAMCTNCCCLLSLSTSTVTSPDHSWHRHTYTAPTTATAGDREASHVGSFLSASMC